MSKKVDPKQQASKQSPTKGKKQSKNTIQANILQTMRSEIDFLSIFSLGQIQYLMDNYDIIVFQRGMILAKQKQIVDYIGVILTGGAIGQKSKRKYKKNDFLYHQISFYGLQEHHHKQTITGQSDGIMFAIRIQQLINTGKNQIQLSIKNKIVNYISQQTLCQLKKQKVSNSHLSQQFELLDQKLSSKFVQSNKLLSSLYECCSDPKQKQKFIQQFPIYCAKQKSLIASKHSSPYLLLILKGQIIIKYGYGVKKQSKVLQSNSLYNLQGFIFGHNEYSNVYASSSEVVFIMISKQRLYNNYKLNTIFNISKYCLQSIKKINQYQFTNIVSQSQGNFDIIQVIKWINEGTNNKQIWSPFRKSYQIQQIPKKQSIKSTNSKQSTNKKKQSINVFQTLYQTYSNQPKNKLKSKQTQLTQFKQSQYNNVNLGFTKQSGINFNKQQKSNIGAVVKTQFSMDQKSHKGTNNQKLKKLQSELLSLKQHNLNLTNTIKKIKLQLLQSNSKLQMINVFRQINNLKVNKQSQESSQINKVQNKTVTLKQAFQIHLKNKKLQLLVAKCAYKWLSITRQNKNKRQNQSTASLLSKSLNKSTQPIQV